MGKALKSIDVDNLNRKQVSFLKNYFKSETIKEACKKTGITRQCYYEWRKTDPEFRETLKDVRNLVFRDGFEELRYSVSDVVRKLVYLSQNAEQESIQLGACKTVLKLGLKWNDIKELEERIVRLEETLDIS